jgi:hypothetical protein|uniref:Uncharacterized protein n=1 Tax=Gadus morhua TaxID=8049 RepID=A0A8C5CTA8_GADMO
MGNGPFTQCNTLPAKKKIHSLEELQLQCPTKDYKKLRGAIAGLQCPTQISSVSPYLVI